MLLVALPCLAAVLLPGWSARLEPVDHEAVLAAARSASPGDVFGVARPGARDGETWHAQYHDSVVARVLHGAGLRGALPGLLPPAFAAHIPVGAERADGYFRVRTSVHWPWWWPGGGVDWSVPESAERR